MSQKITQAFIFAAGRGSRMQPITDTIPKPLVKIHDKSIIDYTIEQLDKIDDINKIIINGFYLKEEIAQHIANLNNDKIIFSSENEKIETGGGLLFAADKIDQNQPLLTINGDILCQKNLADDINKLLDFWNKNDCEILLGLKKKEEYIGYDSNEFGGGDFNLDHQTGQLTKLENCAMDYVFTGLQIINPKILSQPQTKEFGSIFSLSKIYKSAIQNDKTLKNIKGIELDQTYFHIGTPEAIKNTETAL